MPVAEAAAATAISRCWRHFLPTSATLARHVLPFGRPYVSTTRKSASKQKLDPLQPTDVPVVELSNDVPGTPPSDVREQRRLEEESGVRKRAKNLGASHDNNAPKKPRSSGHNNRKSKYERDLILIQPGEDLVSKQDEKRRKRPRQATWISFLDRKTLGEAASVLVLRDAERKKRNQNSALDRESDKDLGDSVNVVDILASIKNRSLDPAQQEVNQNIELIRPIDFVQDHDRPPRILSARYEEVAKTLCDGFNQTQLARFITAYTTLSGTEAPGASSSDVNGLSRRGSAQASTWTVLSTTTPNATGRSKPTPVSRGKRALADIIIRSIWGFEVQEEIECSGTLRVQVSTEKLAVMLAGDDTSPLKEIAITRRARIDSDCVRGIIEITSDKYTCIQVAEDIERLVHQVQTVDFDLRPFTSLGKRPDNRHLSPDIISLVAERCRCTVKASKTGNKVTISGQALIDIELCQRMLVNMLLYPTNGTEETLVLNNTSIDSGRICAVPKGLKSLPYRYRRRQMGRFSAPHKLAKGVGGTPVSLRTPSNVIDNTTLDRICTHLRQPISGENGKINGASKHAIRDLTDGAVASPKKYAVKQPQLHADIGQLLHVMEEKVMVQISKSNDLLDSGSKRCVFTTATSGLPHFLLTSFPKSQGRRKDILRIPLIVSPWDPQAISGQTSFPDLELNLIVEPVSRIIKIESLNAILGTHAANVMLPNLGTDVRFTMTNVLSFVHPDNEPYIRDFVREVQNTAVGYGNIRPPLFLRIKIPTWTGTNYQATGTNAGHSLDEDEIEVDYFATGIEYEESLLFDYEGQELAFRRVGGGELGVSYEGFSLHCLTPAPESGELPTQASEVGQEDGLELQSEYLDIQGFVRQVSGLLRELNMGVGNMDMLSTEPRKSHVRATEQRRTGYDPYRTRRLSLDTYEERRVDLTK